jgi:hypothetical protein
MTPADLSTIRRLNRLARIVGGGRGVPPSVNLAAVARAMRMMRRLAPAYARARGRLGRTA